MVKGQSTWLARDGRAARLWERNPVYYGGRRLKGRCGITVDVSGPAMCSGVRGGCRCQTTELAVLEVVRTSAFIVVVIAVMRRELRRQAVRAKGERTMISGHKAHGDEGA